jgi:hypothetical protein
METVTDYSHGDGLGLFTWRRSRIIHTEMVTDYSHGDGHGLFTWRRSRIIHTETVADYSHLLGRGACVHFVYAGMCVCRVGVFVL